MYRNMSRGRTAQLSHSQATQSPTTRLSELGTANDAYVFPPAADHPDAIAFGNDPPPSYRSFESYQPLKHSLAYRLSETSEVNVDSDDNNSIPPSYEEAVVILRCVGCGTKPTRSKKD